MATKLNFSKITIAFLTRYPPTNSPSKTVSPILKTLSPCG